MNLKHWIRILPAVSAVTGFAQTNFGQNAVKRLHSIKPFMSSSFARKLALFVVLIAGIPAGVFGQTNYYATNGTEYAIVGSLLGDQVLPDAAVTSNGGFVVWQDNITDGDGLGVSAMQVNGTLSGSGSSFRVNVQGAGNQENPRLALLQGGGAVFVWQGGQPGQQHIYARFLGSGNTWLTGDVAVNTFAGGFQNHPAVATLTNGNVVVVWESFCEAAPGSLLDVYGQILSPTGQKIGGEFLINQFTSYNQLSPAVTALNNGGFVVAWISEQERAVATANPNPILSSQISNPSVDVYARLYNGSYQAQGGEFLVNTDLNPCGNPTVAAAADGGFVVGWNASDLANPANGIDVFARTFSSGGVGGTVLRVNTYLSGNQYAPRVSSLGADYLMVWTSFGQDGSGEGVYGQFMHEDGSMVGGEFRVNTTTIGRQLGPVVASDGTGQFLVAWSSYTGSPNGFDLFAQRYINTQQPLEPLPAPFVYAPFVVSNNVYQPQLVVSWPPVTGLSISNYEVYGDGAATPTAVTVSNVWTMTAANGLTTNSIHSFRVDYVTTDGRRSPLSPPASGATWNGQSWGGIPFEWMTKYYGNLIITFGNNGPVYNWLSPNVPLVPGGPTLLQVFLSGGSPLDSSTWLQTALSNTPEGLFLSWNTQPGFTYQVQATTNFTSWSNLGSPRFAAGATDAVFVGNSSVIKPGRYYRILLLRQ
jgi:hypothetical protein